MEKIKIKPLCLLLTSHKADRYTPANARGIKLKSRPSITEIVKILLIEKFMKENNGGFASVIQCLQKESCKVFSLVIKNSDQNSSSHGPRIIAA
jgi:hypothetical protein